MAPKLTHTMDDPRLPSAYGVRTLPPDPIGPATAIPPGGLLKPNGPLVPGPAGKTCSLGTGPWQGAPRTNSKG